MLDRIPRPVGGYVFAGLFLATAIWLVHIGVVARVAPIVALGTALTSLLFGRTPATVLLLTYALTTLVMEALTAQAEHVWSSETFYHLSIFTIINFAIIWTADRLRLTLNSARRSERNHRLIAQNTTDLILAYDMRGRVIYSNPAFSKLLGYTLEELWSGAVKD